jgi:heat shock protein HslJ
MKRLGKFGAAFAACILWTGCETAKKPVQSGQPAAQQKLVSLVGTQWTLEEIGGKPVIEHSHATLAFMEAGRISGNGSCNRFMGPVEINGDTIKLGLLAGTKMMCDPAAADQETAYLKALEAAQRFEMNDQKLLIHVTGSNLPLRFHAAAAGQN